MAEPLVRVESEARIAVTLDSGRIAVVDGPVSTTLTARSATPESAFAELARFAMQLTEAIADAADQYGIE